MTIALHIPAISELAAAINNLANTQRGVSAEQQLEEIRINQLRHDQRQAERDADEAAAQSQNLSTPPADAPAKRTRRTKAEMEEAKKIEDLKGRRTDPPAGVNPDRVVGQEPEPIEQVSALVDEANPEPFQWTFPLLKETFIDPITPADDSEEEKARVKELRNELVEIRKAVDPDAQNLTVMKTEAYGPFAAKATAWYAEKGLDLNLPEGAQ